MTAFVAALFVAAVGTPVLAGALRRWDMVDVPNHRSSHEVPVPRGGGVAVALATVVGMALGATWTRAITVLVVGSLVLCVTGLLDDRFSLPAVPRLAVQLITPLVAALVVADRSGVALVVAMVVATVAAAGYVNAFNFMDGINGISGLQAAVAGAFLALLAGHHGLVTLEVAGWAVAGASLGFLPFNAVRGRIFLGDVGSYFLGFWLAGLALLIADRGVSVVVVVAPFVLYVLETSSVLFRRARRGEPLMVAHREHAYQRLVALGWRHLSVAFLSASVSAVSAAIMYAAMDASSFVQAAALGACVALVVAYLSLPTIVERTGGRVAGGRP